MSRRAVVTVGVAVALAAVLGAFFVRGALDDGSGSSPSSSEPLRSFESVTSGVALMEALDCEGQPLVVSDGTNEHRVRGTGFLVGTCLLMGVEHMIPQTPGVICGFRARLGGRWYDVGEVNVWNERGEERLGAKSVGARSSWVSGTSTSALTRWRTAPASTTNLVIGYLWSGVGASQH